MNTGAVVVTYQTSKKMLQNCLASLHSSGIQDISVVNNTPAGNLGFATAANTGAARLSNKYLLFINPDASLSPGAHKIVQNYLDNHPNIGIIGLLLTSPTGHPEVHSFGSTVTPLSLITRHLVHSNIPTRPTLVGWVSGAAMLIRRSLFQQLGGFDSRFFMYWEDVDLCRRAHQTGWKITLLPQAKAVHRRGASFSRGQHKTKLYDQSADKYFCKHYPDMICLLTKSARSLYRFFSPLSS